MRSAGRAPAAWGAGWDEFGWLGVVWFGSRLGAAVVAAAIGGPSGADPGGSVFSLILLQVPFWGLTLGGTWFALRRLGRSPMPSTGWEGRPVDALWGLVWGIGLQWLVAGLYAVIEWFAGPLDLDGPAQDLVERSRGPGGTVALLVMVGVAAPVVEEVFYRGWMQGAVARRATGRFGSSLAVGASAVVFGLSHFQGVQLPGLILIGVVLGVLFARTGRLATSIATHAVFNICTVVVLLGVRVPVLPH